MELGNIVRHFQSVLGELHKIFDKFKELDPVAQSLDGKLRRVWKELDWIERTLMSVEAGSHQYYAIED